MKRPNITPGPWFVTQAANKPVKIETLTCRRVCTMADTPEDQREAKARARAIAAVPALLEALETSLAMAEAMQEVMPTDELPKAIAEIKTALTKAGYTF